MAASCSWIEIARADAFGDPGFVTDLQSPKDTWSAGGHFWRHTRAMRADRLVATLLHLQARGRLTASQVASRELSDPVRATLRDRLRRLVPGIARRIPPGRVAVLRLYGPIGGAGRTAEWIELTRRLRESKRVPAVVLDVDSPGGSATGSDDLFLALERLAAKKPLVAAIRGTGASGAYLAAVAARRIIANPTAIVGSIGVINVAPRLPRLLDRLGVNVSEHTAGRLKGMGAPWRDESVAEAEKEQAIVDGIYESFVGRVSEARNLTRERARELATGEVWLGRDAIGLGLVDEIGDLERAIEIAAEMAGVRATAYVVRVRRPLLGRLVDRFAASVARSIADEIETRLGDRLRM
jgi:protease IV